MLNSCWFNATNSCSCVCPRLKHFLAIFPTSLRHIFTPWDLILPDCIKQLCRCIICNHWRDWDYSTLKKFVEHCKWTNFEQGQKLNIQLNCNLYFNSTCRTPRSWSTLLSPDSVTQGCTQDEDPGAHQTLPFALGPRRYLPSTRFSGFLLLNYIICIFAACVWSFITWENDVWQWQKAGSVAVGLPMLGWYFLCPTCHFIMKIYVQNLPLKMFQPLGSRMICTNSCGFPINIYIFQQLCSLNLDYISWMFAQKENVNYNRYIMILSL